MTSGNEPGALQNGNEHNEHTNTLGYAAQDLHHYPESRSTLNTKDAVISLPDDWQEVEFHEISHLKR
jgi:hypothetical protein